jgi:hypothetical protein
VQKRSGEWDDFFLGEVVIHAQEYGPGRRPYFITTPALPIPLPTKTRTPNRTPFRDREYCLFDSSDPHEVFERARNIIFPMGQVGSYHWTLTEELKSQWEHMVAVYHSDRVLAAVLVYALGFNAPFGSARDVAREFSLSFLWYVTASYHLDSAGLELNPCWSPSMPNQACDMLSNILLSDPDRLRKAQPAHNGVYFPPGTIN